MIDWNKISRTPVGEGEPPFDLIYNPEQVVVLELASPNHLFHLFVLKEDERAVRMLFETYTIMPQHKRTQCDFNEE